MTTSDMQVQGRPDPELMAPSLDLRRPELAEVMARYTPGLPLGTEVEPPERSALIVRNGLASATETEEAFEHAGWVVKNCAGPSFGNCPLLRHENCELRESVDVAVVFVDPHVGAPETRSLVRVRCAADSSSPGVVAINGSIESERYAGRNAVVGARRPDAIVKTARKLLD